MTTVFTTMSGTAEVNMKQRIKQYSIPALRTRSSFARLSIISVWTYSIRIIISQLLMSIWINIRRHYNTTLLCYQQVITQSQTRSYVVHWEAGHHRGAQGSVTSILYTWCTYGLCWWHCKQEAQMTMYACMCMQCQNATRHSLVGAFTYWYSTCWQKQIHCILNHSKIIHNHLLCLNSYTINKLTAIISENHMKSRIHCR